MSERKPRLILHVGMGKTGSSALQMFFARNRRVLPLFGLHYPKAISTGFTGANSQRDLSDALRHECMENSPHPVIGDSSNLLGRYVAKAARRRTTLLSSEGLAAPDPNIAKLFSPLGEQFDIRVIIYLRRQDEWGLSTYRERVVNTTYSEARPFLDWLNAPETNALMDYGTILENWRNAVGQNAITVLRYPYETPLLPAFLRAAELTPALLALPFHKKRVRESVSDDVLMRRLKENGGAPEPIRFDQDARDSLMRDFRVSNKQVCQIYRPELARLFGRT